LYVDHFGIAVAQGNNATAAGFYLKARLTVASARRMCVADGQTLRSRKRSKELSLFKAGLAIADGDVASVGEHGWHIQPWIGCDIVD